MPRRLAQQRMTLSDLERPFHASPVISAIAELLVFWKELNQQNCQQQRRQQQQRELFRSFLKSATVILLLRRVTSRNGRVTC